MSKRLPKIPLLLLLLFAVCCNRDGDGVLSNKAKQDMEVVSEARDGDLKNPGGVKDVRREADDAQQQTENALKQLDQQ